MYYSQTARLAIYADKAFGKGQTKTADGLLRYGKNPVVAVIDSVESGKTVEEVAGIPCSVPIVGSLAEALKFEPDALLLGTASAGGRMPPEWKPEIIYAIKNKLDIINGLHDFLTDDPDLVKFASVYGCKLLDVRKPPDEIPVGSGRAVNVPSFICLTVGSDGSVGKMTTSLELNSMAETLGFKSKFVATGQTGIMIDGTGISIDRVIGDFMAGATEKLVMDVAFDNELIFVEGQGSIIHPGWSGVTLGLLHGACPHAMILCHKGQATHLKDAPFPIPKLSQLVTLYETMAAYVRSSKVVGLSINTFGLDDETARRTIDEASAETGLPATDPVRYGVDNLLEALLSYREKLS